MDPIEALADCIMQFEGWKPPISIAFPRGSTSWRNRNPGNLRPINDKQLKDDKGYRIFPSLGVGWQALKDDLNAKINYGAHSLTLQNTLHDLFSIYAPPTDNNDPQQYSKIVASWLGHIYNSQVTPDITLEDLMKLGK